MSKSLKTSIKIRSYIALNGLGANAVARYLNRNKIRIFALHGVADYSRESDWVPLRAQMDVSRFRACIDLLSQHYEFISMDVAVQMLSGRSKMRKNCVVLTFDDGYQNNFSEALPVLQDLEVPGVFYVATDYITHRMPYWFDRLDFALQQAAGEDLEFEFNGKEYRLTGMNRSQLRSAYASLRNDAKKVYRDEHQFVGALGNLAEKLESATGTALRSRLR